MELEEAVLRLQEIATGDKEKEAFDKVMFALESYRTLYEGELKRLSRFRDIASHPEM